MKSMIIKGIIIFIIALCVSIPGGLLLSGLSGCARVRYKNITPSVKCNFTYMLIQLKSMKGMEAFEVGEFVRKCYEDLNVIKCRERVYKGNIDNDEKKKLEFLRCLKE